MPHLEFIAGLPRNTNHVRVNKIRTVYVLYIHTYMNLLNCVVKCD